MKLGNIDMRKKLFLLSCVVSCLAITHATVLGILYSLPSFSMVIQVRKADNALILFQDRLENAIRDHLNDFFTSKVNTRQFQYGSVQEVALSSRMVWRELDDSISQEIASNQEEDDIVWRNYEVRADFDCQVSFNLEADVAAARLSQPIMDLLLIEALQGDNYWHLLHLFLSDDVLNAIGDVEIAVRASGFQANNGSGEGQAVFMSNGGSHWTGPMIAGVVFAALFILVLCCLRLYIVLYVRGCYLSRFIKSNEIKEDSMTDQDSAELDFGFDDDDSSWMDAWARAITSIPIREPEKPRKSSRRTRRPARQVHSVLFRIVEDDIEDNKSTCSVGNIPTTDIVLYQPDYHPQRELCSLA